MVNFRQFKGEMKVEFAHGPSKNVTIILGNNTFGKTTLLQAFNWCFFEDAQFKTEPDFLLNLDVRGSMPDGSTAEVEVEIVLYHAGKEYIITRSQRYSKNNGVVRPLQVIGRVSYRQRDGQIETVKASQVTNVINSILPVGLASYFFFDTERVQSIGTRKDLADAVKGLLGLSIVENAIKHLGTKSTKNSVIGKFYGAMDVEGDSRATDALTRVQDAENKREVVKLQLETCLSEIEHYDNRKSELETILRDNHSTSALYKSKEALEKRVGAERAAQDAITQDIFAEFNSRGIQFFSQALTRQAMGFLKEVKIDDKGVKDLNAVAIMDIIRRGKCICGSVIAEGNAEYECLMTELAYVPPESIGSTVRHYVERLKSLENGSSRIFDGIKRMYEELHRSKVRVQDWTDEIEVIGTKIEGKENMAKYEQELTDAKHRLKGLQEKKDRLIRDDEALKKDMERYQKIYDSLIAVSEKNKAALLYIAYAEAIKEWLVAMYKDKEMTIRQRLQERVNSIFGEMYHGRRRVIISPNYEVTLLSTVADDEIETGESEGASRVKSFAFIAGLVSLAKEQTPGKDANNIQLSSEPYPLIMDAPFSNADEVHTANISSVLPRIAEQVIMFVMRKDWRYAEPQMAQRVGRMYELNKHSETHTELKGV